MGKIDELKNRLGPIENWVSGLKKETEKSLCGPCPNCGGTNRFVIRQDTGRAMCRQCHQGWMDIIDFQDWRFGKSINDLLNEYLPDIPGGGAGSRQASPPATDQREKAILAFIKKRCFNEKFFRELISSGKIKVSKYAEKLCLSVAYKSLDGKVRTTEFFTLDHKPFPFTERNGSPVNKVFKKGSKIAEPCFFMPGMDDKKAKTIVFVESPWDAVAGAQAHHDACWVATGGSSTLVKKTQAFKPHIKDGIEIICFFDNDDAGTKATKGILKILGKKIKSVQWPGGYPPGYDVNDFLKDEQPEKIPELIQNADFVHKPKDKKALPKAVVDPDKPTLYVGAAQLSHTTRIASDILQSGSKNPLCFVKEPFGLVFRKSKKKDTGGVSIMPATPSLVRYYLSELSNCVRKKSDDQEMPISPPKDLCENIIASGQSGKATSFPPLKSVKDFPVYVEVKGKKTLCVSPGYSKDTQYYISNDYSQIKPPDCPSEADIQRARNLIFELFVDFPFTSSAERANTIGLFLSLPVRPLIKGALPLFLVVADQPGTGKTLLAQTVGRVFYGMEPPCIGEGDNYAEWGKILLSALMPAPSLLLIDNIVRKLDSPPLARALTSLVFEDRILGRSEMVKVPVDAVFIGTANQPRLSSEMARRVIRISLNSGLDRPQDRDQETFTHPNLREWVSKNRFDILWAFLVLIQNWISKGCPMFHKTLGSFEEWSKIVGGILEVNGIHGFLGNLKESFEDFDDEGHVLRAFVSAWYHSFGCSEVGVADLHNIIIKEDIPLPLGDKSERSQKIILGKYLVRLKSRRVDIPTEGYSGGTVTSGFMIMSGRTVSRVQQWKLTYCPDEATNPDLGLQETPSPDTRTDRGENVGFAVDSSSTEPLTFDDLENLMDDPGSVNTCQNCKYSDRPGELCCYHAMKGKSGRSIPVQEAYYQCPLKAEHDHSK